MPTSFPAPEQRWQSAASGNRSRNPKRIDNLEVSTSDDGCVVSQPGIERLHFLNPTAALILEFCTGKNSTEQIADLVKEAYGLPEPPVEDTRKALLQLKSEGLLV